MKKTLILTDCQQDFITGSMSVKKRCRECTEKIKIYINRNKEDIDSVIFKCTFNSPYSSLFKRNGGEYPMFCVEHTPGACIEPTILKLLWRLNIPYQIVESLQHVFIPEDSEVIISGMNGNTTLKDTVDRFWNQFMCSIYWPGCYFTKHDEDLFRYLKNKAEGIFEVPKRQKTDLFVNQSKKQLR